MHIPDGFVSGPVAITGAAAAAAAVGFSLWRTGRQAAERPRVVPLLATTAAFVFAAQMLNFPIGGGTSGHFLGAVAAAALLGPWSACLVMTLVLVVQCLLFGDGGLTALGINIVNMGVIGGLGGYLLLRGLRKLLPSGRTGFLIAAGAASWAVLVIAAAACALELALSGRVRLGVGLVAMVGVHAIIGIGEALIAVAVLGAVAAARPDVMPQWAALEAARTPARGRFWALAGAGLLVSLVLAIFASPFASGHPDGLEKVAEDQGFLEAASEDKEAWKSSPMADYAMPGVAAEGPATGLAGLAGTAITFALGFGAIRLAGGRGRKD